jgi:transposase InsO family protein
VYLNQDIVDKIKKTSEDQDTDYGYIKMTYELKTLGFIINKKKVYRLMKEHNLLKDRHKKHDKTYAKYRKVLPQKPLHVLEMDMKFVWVEELRKHAYILTVIDTFTRMVLRYIVKYSITQNDVKNVWNHIIINHLQPNDCLLDDLVLEIRNDNDKRFSAKMVQDFFKQNYLNQVFTHPYTPQENGHIESFHSILSTHLLPYRFWSMEELSQNLILFYEKYNNVRIHGSIAYTSPRTFWDLYQKKLIEKTEDLKRKKITFKLKIPYHHIIQHTGNKESEGSFSHDFEPLDGAKKSNVLIC